MTIRMFPGPALSQGQAVEQFEAELARFLNVPSWACIAVNTGTAALHLALLQIPYVKAVSVPATTFIATANAVLYAGMKTEIADVDPESWMWNGQHNESPTILVDLYGNRAAQTVNKDSVVVEDACEALGTVGVPYAKLSCFSFFASKIITTGGEGGAVVALAQEDAERVRLQRQQGKNFSMEKHQILGFNYRMTEHQARYGLRELRKLPARLARCREINSQYRNLLSSFKFQADHQGNCWQTALVVENRNELLKTLIEKGIETKKVFCSLAEYPWLWSDQQRPNTPVADWLAEHGLCIPSHHSLTDGQVAHVANVINKFGRTCQYAD